jgi:hypothetical protein
MKYFILSSLFYLIFITGTAQQVREENIKFDGKKGPGIVAEIPYPPDVVENAFKDRMAREGYKGTPSRGWTIYKGVKLKSLGDERVDVYVNIERKSRREKDVSEVQLLLSKGYDNFVEKSGGREFIDEVHPVAEAMALELEIKNQEETLKKSQRKFDDLVTDSLELEKKKKKLEEALVDNSRKQGEQKEDIKKQQAILEELRSRRKAKA